ncbi:MAG: NADH-quinone oxidoreductase subunit A [Myxococcales bacterium]|nr:NADH-quinone oxidoreductase subunit A [Myxococcales bacterium]
MLMAYASVLAFFAVAGGFVLVSMLAGTLIRPNNPYSEKRDTYECGEAPVGPAWFNFNPRFYIIALIFIIFDVEIAFIYPVARVFRGWVAQGHGLYAFVEIFTFVAILLLGLVYVWKKGDLEWIRAFKGDPRGAEDVTSKIKAPDVAPAAATERVDRAA